MKKMLKKLLPFVAYIPFIGIIAISYKLSYECINYELYTYVVIGLFNSLALSYVAIKNLITDIKNF